MGSQETALYRRQGNNLEATNIHRSSREIRVAETRSSRTTKTISQVPMRAHPRLENNLLDQTKSSHSCPAKPRIRLLYISLINRRQSQPTARDNMPHKAPSLNLDAATALYFCTVMQFAMEGNQQDPMSTYPAQPTRPFVSRKKCVTKRTGTPRQCAHSATLSISNQRHSEREKVRKSHKPRLLCEISSVDQVHVLHLSRPGLLDVLGVLHLQCLSHKKHRI